jgi:glycolate oxidase FAD binding subunit
MDRDDTADLIERVVAASAAGSALRIVGGDTRPAYGRAVAGTALHVSGHCGVLAYDPAELVITARCGTSLADLEALLHAHGQCLPFEPPRFGAASTLGGTIAAGLAGPARVTRGPVRDYVLGARLLTGDGRVLRFGGEVMKNVAGYDVARLLAGSLGILGVILDVSLKVLPMRPTLTVALACSSRHAIDMLASDAISAASITGSAWWRDRLRVRLEGSAFALNEILHRLDGEIVADDAASAFWREIRDQAHEFFTRARNLWRINLPALAPIVQPTGVDDMLIEWHGAQRWYADTDADVIAEVAHAGGGFATAFRTSDSGSRTDTEVFAPLATPVMALHRALKRSFDPAGILNPGRMYAGL